MCFPGFFRGLLDSRARGINAELAAARAIASAVPGSQLSEEYIMPNVFERSVARVVAREVAAVAQRTGVAQRLRHRRTFATARTR